MVRGLAVLVVLATLLVGGAASAQQAGQDVGQTTTYNFEDDIVTGDLVRPDGELAVARNRSRQSSLIRIREHFVPEMLKSVENL
jgi:hypothetical protein